ncbi:MAG: 4Fe-4S dicluster domain-containing protein [Chloroflexota bacterium]
MAQDAYLELARRLEYPPSPRLLHILKKMASPEEARVLLELPGEPAGIGRRLGMSGRTVKAAVKDLWRRGLAYDRGKGLEFAPNLPILHFCLGGSADFVDAKLLRLWREFFEGEWSQVIPDRWETLKRRMGEVVPAARALDGLPDVQPEEDIRQIIGGAEVLAVVPCACRRPLRKCEAALDNCLVVDDFARDILKKGWGKRVSVKKALALTEEAEALGLVHMTARMGGTLAFLCNCCGDCCHILYPGLRRGNLTKVIDRCRFRAAVDPERCTGCQDCIERCLFGAISLRRFSGAKKWKAVVDAGKCFGCGLCVVGCEPHAARLVLPAA